MKESLRIGRIELCWLNGGVFRLDGGAMFGVVPKALWARKYPCDDMNRIRLLNSPMLLRTPDALVLVETGIGNKLSDKQKKIFGVERDWSLADDLRALGHGPGDIDYVVLTHCDFDHAGGIATAGAGGDLSLTFPNAKHVIQRAEWEDAMSPNIRSKNTYWAANFEPLRHSGNLMLVDGDAEIAPGVSVRHTGGHTRGHQIVVVSSGGEAAYHLADLLPSHVHFNPLWIMAFDNFPLDVIRLKQELEGAAIRENAWFTFYHDPFVRACKFDSGGNMTDRLEVGEAQ